MTDDQAIGLELVGQGHNLVISTGTASGKSDDCSHGSAYDFRSIPPGGFSRAQPPSPAPPVFHWSAVRRRPLASPQTPQR